MPAALTLMTAVTGDVTVGGDPGPGQITYPLINYLLLMM